MKETLERSELKEIMRLGLEALIQKLGYSGTTRFIMAIERGEGDSVKEFREFWRGKTASDIHDIIKESLRERKIKPPTRSKSI
ncbi:MAG: hypothetical protein ACE5Z5_07775 [Candidatus Bathyarchaeia archaeon]